MRSVIAATAAVFLMSSAGTAPAAESSMLAIKAGFLLGHAQRCGVAAERVEAVAKGIRGAIAAAALDDEEKQKAGSRFTLIFIASAFPDKQDQHALIPACNLVTAQFQRLEKHQRQVAAE